jgi:hypothetical protein
VLCGSEEFNDLEVLAEPGGATIKGFSEEIGKIMIETL